MGAKRYNVQHPALYVSVNGVITLLTGTVELDDSQIGSMVERGLIEECPQETKPRQYRRKKEAE